MTKTTHHCTRCQAPISGKGRTGMCHPCASVMVGRRTWHGAASKAGHRGGVETRRQAAYDRALSQYAEPSLPRFKCLEDVE